MGKTSYNTTAYKNSNDLIYGNALHPVKLANGMSIGGGTVYPEVNFTLPPMTVKQDTIPEALAHYKQIITGICERAHDLSVPGFVAEIETLPPFTEVPEWGIEVCKIVVDTIKEYDAKYGVKGAVRITPNDIREGSGLEHMWKGSHWDRMLKTFEGCAKVGADFLSIESIGGKEVHDEACMYCDIAKALFGMAVIGCTDMNKLWTEVVAIGEKNGSTPAGDTACGFANTAMVLAEKNYIPRVFGAVIRVMASVRSLVAFECGCKGPDKDCGYEGVYIKAITGMPISMEGRTSACAHLTRVGNIAACMPDIWSNESTPNIMLLGGMAPTVSLEQLAYDCRLMNEASKRGKETALLLRDLHADSDSKLDPHAYILRPDVVLDIASEYVKVDGYYPRMKKAAEVTVDRLSKAVAKGDLIVNDKEKMWLDNLGETLSKLTNDVAELTASQINDCENFNPKLYDM